MKSYLLLALALLLSCNKDANFLHEDLTPPMDERKQTYRIVDLVQFGGKVDVIFVIDNSGSMGWIQDNIVKNSATFLEEFIKMDNLDWKMGIMSTSSGWSSDVYEVSSYLGFDTPFTVKTPNAVSVFQNAVSSLGTSGSGSERVFYNIDRVLEARTNFLRHRAQLAVIMVSDEVEQSDDEDSVLYEPANFTQKMREFLNKDNMVRFYGALQMRDFPKCTNWNGGGEYGPYAGSRYEKVVQETGGFTISACADDFGTQLAEIGNDIVSFSNYTRIPLGPRPNKDTIKVIYKGEELPSGSVRDGGKWFYDEYFNTINIYTLEFAEDLEDELDIQFVIDDGYNRDA